jgi:hypothetical protein
MNERDSKTEKGISNSCFEKIKKTLINLILSNIQNK